MNFTGTPWAKRHAKNKKALPIEGRAFLALRFAE